MYIIVTVLCSTHMYIVHVCIISIFGVSSIFGFRSIFGISFIFGVSSIFGVRRREVIFTEGAK